MEIKAKLTYLRMAPRKVRRVIDLIRGLEVMAALNQLNFAYKRAGLPIAKLLKSAVNNAENNFHLKKDNLYIKKITADEGPKLKRWQPRAFGRANPILKRSSHVELILAEKKPTKKLPSKTKGKKEDIKKEDLKVIKSEEIKERDVKEANKPAVEKKERKPFLNIKEIKDKFIRRTGTK
ncbi:MAG: 50S ribosomal protein L22 [Patescibacteria group bacterium]